MDDRMITELFWNRSERGPEELYRKYGAFLYRVAWNMLSEKEDSEECVNDTILATWNTIPENRPDNLRLYTARITRNLAITKLRERGAEKRGERVTELLSELGECVPEPTENESVESEYGYRLLVREINGFVSGLDDLHACIFVRRYWLGESLSRISRIVALPEKTVATDLFRIRRKLKKRLETAGFVI